MIVQGKDVVLYVDDAGTLKPICCARNASLSLTSDIAETSTLGTGKWKTYRGLRLSFILNCSGLVSFDMNMSLGALRNYQIGLQPIGFSFIAFDKFGNSEKYTGSVIVSTTDSPTTYNSAFEYSMQGQGTGELAIDTLYGLGNYDVFWGWSTVKPTTGNIEAFVFQESAFHTTGGITLDVDFTNAPPDNYFAVKYPLASLPAFTKWKNTVNNYGQIPDQVFNPIYTSGGFHYIFSRVKPVLDSLNEHIVFS